MDRAIEPWVRQIVDRTEAKVDIIAAIKEALVETPNAMPSTPRDVLEDPEHGRTFEWIRFGRALEKLMEDQQTYPDRE